MATQAPTAKAGEQPVAASAGGGGADVNLQGGDLAVSLVAPHDLADPQGAARDLAKEQAALVARDRADSQVAAGDQGLAKKPVAAPPGQILPSLTEAAAEREWKTVWGADRVPLVLGKGSFGSVTLAMHRSTGTLAARKSTRAVHDSELEMAQYFFRHPHPNVLQALAHVSREGRAGSTIYYELADETVHDRQVRQNGIFSASLARHIVQGILSGLAHLHHHGTIHRDLKFQNVLLRAREDGPLQVIVADFGWACSWGGSDSPRTPGAVTWPYRAPEATLQIDYGPSSDLWPLGVLSRELLTGVYLWEQFRTDTPLQHAARLGGKICEETWAGCTACAGWDPSAADVALEPMSRKRVPWAVPDAEDLCRQMLALLPEARPTAAAASRHPWLLQTHSLRPTRRALLKQPPAATPWKMPRPHDPARAQAPEPAARRLAAAVQTLQRLEAEPPAAACQLAAAGQPQSTREPPPLRPAALASLGEGDGAEVRCKCKGNCRSGSHSHGTPRSEEGNYAFPPCRHHALPGRAWCQGPSLAQQRSSGRREEQRRSSSSSVGL